MGAAAYYTRKLHQLEERNDEAGTVELFSFLEKQQFHQCISPSWLDFYDAFIKHPFGQRYVTSNSVSGMTVLENLFLLSPRFFDIYKF